MTDTKEKIKDGYKTSRQLYIAEAALEYFIAVMVEGAYLARLTDAIGMSDALTGILTSFISLGNTFQIVAVFLNRKSVKHRVICFHLANQMLFTLLYVIPLAPLSSAVKCGIFTVSLLLGQIISNIINPVKINWLMGLVPDGKRGIFTANKEIVSLTGEMAFSLIMGKLVDHYQAKNDIRHAFIIMAITLFSLTVLHTLTLVFSKERPNTAPVQSTRQNVGALLRDRQVFKIIVFIVLWNIAHYAIVPFTGSYKIKELGFSMTFISFLTIGYGLVRAFVSRPIGRYADRHSFVSMLKICYIIETVSVGINVFIVPGNGHWLYPVGVVLDAAAMAGINGGLVNLIYDYVDPEHRTGALALKSFVAGIGGFVSTLIMSIPVNVIQSDGNRLFGLPIYAQQFTAFVSLVLQIIVLLYLFLVLDKLPRRRTVFDTFRG